MKSVAYLSWNIVTKNFNAHDQLKDKLQEKLSKLARHLAHFPAGAVHLQIILEKHPKKALFTAGLVLRVPSNILRSEKSAVDPVPAFDSAMRTLQRELASLKAELRHEDQWKSKARRAELAEARESRFASEPLPLGTGPQSIDDVIGDLIQQNHKRILRYIRRQIAHGVAVGDLTQGAVEPRAVLDEVARIALAAPDRKPENLSYLIWLYQLARKEVERRRLALQVQLRETVPLDEARRLEDDAEAADGYEPERPLNIIEEELEAPIIEIKDMISDTHTDSPAEAAARKDLLEHVQGLASGWSKTDHDVFELYFVEGFEPDEIAMILGVSLAKAEEAIDSVQGHIRQSLLAEAEV